MHKTELESCAKINLTLEVSAPRGDGYHDIDSVVQSIDLADELTITKAPNGVINVIAEAPDIPSGPENLVYRACKAFFSASGVRGGASCTIRKHIPPEAGLGGGSGNAAAAIVGMNRLYETGLDQARLVAIAATVGSDVPLFVCGGTVRMRGRGEIVEPLPDAPVFETVTIKPKRGVSTPWAYAELDKRTTIDHRGASDVAEKAVRSGDKDGLCSAMMNDFDPVVTGAFPEIAAAKQFLIDAGARRALLCGSGSSVFGLFDTREEAEAVADRARSEASAFKVFVSSFVSRPD